MNTQGKKLLARLRHHVTGAIERGEGFAIVEQPSKATVELVKMQKLKRSRKATHESR